MSEISNPLLDFTVSREQYEQMILSSEVTEMAWSYVDPDRNSFDLKGFIEDCRQRNIQTDPDTLEKILTNSFTQSKGEIQW